MTPSFPKGAARLAGRDRKRGLVCGNLVARRGFDFPMSIRSVVSGPFSRSNAMFGNGVVPQMPHAPLLRSLCWRLAWESQAKGVFGDRQMIFHDLRPRLGQISNGSSATKMIGAASVMTGFRIRYRADNEKSIASPGRPRWAGLELSRHLHFPLATTRLQ